MKLLLWVFAGLTLLTSAGYAADAGHKPPWPTDVRQGFLKVCTSPCQEQPDPGQCEIMYDQVCTCALYRLQSKYDYSQFQQVAKTPELNDTVTQCAQRFMQQHGGNIRH